MVTTTATTYSKRHRLKGKKRGSGSDDSQVLAVAGSRGSHNLSLDLHEPHSKSNSKNHRASGPRLSDSSAQAAITALLDYRTRRNKLGKATVENGQAPTSSRPSESDSRSRPPKHNKSVPLKRAAEVEIDFPLVADPIQRAESGRHITAAGPSDSKLRPLNSAEDNPLKRAVRAELDPVTASRSSDPSESRSRPLDSTRVNPLKRAAEAEVNPTLTADFNQQTENRQPITSSRPSDFKSRTQNSNIGSNPLKRVAEAEIGPPLVVDPQSIRELGITAAEATAKPKPRPRKKQKITQENTTTTTTTTTAPAPAPAPLSQSGRTSMALQPIQFQTPFPTLQAQSQVFRLPSSKPQPSPEEGRGISPAVVAGRLSPQKAKAKSKSKDQKENLDLERSRKSGNTTSRSTETLRSTRTHGDLSKTLSSLTLASSGLPPGSRPNSRLSRRHHTHTENLESRPSSSCSSRSSASNAARKPKAKPKPKHKVKSGLRHSQSLTSLRGSDGVTDAGEVRKGKKKKSNLSSKMKFNSSRTLSSGPFSNQDENDNGNYLTLASPFVSRASSPVGDSAAPVRVNAPIVVHRVDTDTGTQLMGPPSIPDRADARKRPPSGHGLRTALSEVFNHDFNLPHHDSRAAGKSRLQSTHTSPQKVKIDFTNLDKSVKSKLKSKTTSKSKHKNEVLPSSRTENRPPTSKHQRLATSERERRPSAPSWLHPPKPTKRILERPVLDDGDDGGPLPWEKQRLKLASGLDIVLGTTSKANAETRGPASEAEPTMRVDVPQDAQVERPKEKKQKTVHNSHFHTNPRDEDEEQDPMEWMHTRRDVDFNRPPSRLSIGGSGFGSELGFGFDYGDGFEYGDGEDVFWSSASGSENSDFEDREDDEERQQRKRRISSLDLNLNWTLGMSINEKFEVLFGRDVVRESTPAVTNWNVKSEGTVGAGPGANEKVNAQAVVDKRTSHAGDLLNVAGDKASKPKPLSWSSSWPGANGSRDPPGPAVHQKTKDTKVQQSDAVKGGIQYKAHADEGEEGEADMDLTADVASTAIKVSHLPPTIKTSESDPLDADMTPWVTDSIISPPTVYLAKLRAKKPSDSGGDGQGTLPSEAQLPVRLSSPFRPPEPGSPETGANTSYNVLPTSEHAADDDLEHEQTLSGEYHESTSESSSDTIGPHTSIVVNATQEDEARLAAANAKRTRSGTIVPVRPTQVQGTAGARRTRSGTIVAPVPPAPPPAKPLPAVPAGDDTERDPGHTRRTRSGTIVPSGPSSAGLGRRARSGSVSHAPSKGILVGNLVPPPAPLETSLHANDNFAADQEDEEGVDCYVDSLYLPPLVSSPDPIDFLRFASIVEEEDEGDGGPENEMLWHVADDPPSPEVAKNIVKTPRLGGIFKGRGGKLGALRRKLADKKGKGKKTRFVGRDGQKEAEQEESDTALLGLADEEMSDDELLLVPGGTQSLWI
ncbi:hypothetical protein CVT26_002843 [Gymnopilus dilepis]|uniref:Uncharacterized protein n=1 Tax=Gymnopilus dilepis TaxID=231916 RepID=A0A409VTC4_9AGAR|nr:hypothetical protein CVT26_002843 [Gymnopilus dilepis]